MLEIEKFKKKLKLKNEKLFININDKESSTSIKFNILNEVTFWRAQTIFTKEPITIQWIRNFKKNSIFYDIGANVGIYSIFAALVSKVKVISFEPESGNYNVLMENINLNNLFNKIIAYPVGINNKTSFSKLYLGKFEKGESHHIIDQPLDHNLKKRDGSIYQGVFSTTLDELIDKWNFPIPNYLKIDVDGIESKIISKSTNLLQNNKLKSILIEINHNRKQDKKIIETLLKNNFNFDEKQVKESTRKRGPHKGYAEYLFFRNN